MNKGCLDLVVKMDAMAFLVCQETMARREKKEIRAFQVCLVVQV